MKKIPSKKPKQLNMIFFIDDKKTRTIRLSIKLFTSLVALTTVVFAWGIVSIFMLYQHKNETYNLGKKISLLSEGLFDYQSRFNRIFENTYFQETSAQLNQDHLSSSVPQTAPIQTVTSATKELVNKETTLVVQGIKSDNPPPFSFEEIQGKMANDGWHISFSMRNLAPSTKLKGAVLFLPTLANSKPPQSIDILKNGKSFAIKNFKRDSVILPFNKNEHSSAEIMNFYVVIKTESAKNQQIYAYHVPINKDQFFAKLPEIVGSNISENP